MLFDMIGGDDELAHDVAMHIAASKPKALDENGVPGYRSPARKEKPPVPYSEQPRYPKRNKRK